MEIILREKSWGLALFIGILMFMASCSSQEQKIDNSELVIPGTGACQLVLQQLASAFNASEADFKVIIPETTGSSGGISSVIKKKTILGRVARCFREDEESARLIRIPFAKDAIIFVVGSEVPNNQFTTQQLALIFSGKITMWKKDDGSSKPIRVIYREEGDSSLTQIRRYLPEFSNLEFAADAKIAYHDTEMFKLLDKYMYSIGFLSRSSLLRPNRRYRAIELTDLPLTEENIRSAEYPMVSEYALIYLEGELSDNARKFIDYIRSKAGQNIIKSAGMIPLTEED